MARPMSEVECRAANGKIPENGIAILQISDFGVFEQELYLVFFSSVPALFSNSVPGTLIERRGKSFPLFPN